VVVVSVKITHNLNEMAMEDGIYKQLWRPEEIGASTAGDIIGGVEIGLSAMKLNPKKFKKFNPPNGWGTYEGLVSFTEQYLAACKKHPDARIYVSR
jgi:hypothetical protein